MPQFISEPITPAPGSFDAAAMSRGEPGLPARFTWRGDEYHVTDVLETWTTSTPEGGSGNLYLRRHWWLLRTDRGQTMKIYCERHPRNPQTKQRWFLYTLEEE